MTSLNIQMHNDIMAAGSKERPPMLASGSYVQWQSRFLRYVDLKPNKKLLRKCIFEGPYELTEITTPAAPTYGDNPARDSNDICSTVDSWPNAKGMWIAIERLQQ
ncbi:hypothetical protein Tco_1053772 [Tanacetum coccineum]|uniref:Uncharacterized protein n=1 Tax=Tanacetum coccineum TaxID=301880 RepID=A0ABQ5GUW3_9ASTR